MINRLIGTVESRYPDLQDQRKRHEIVRRQITEMVEDVIATSLENLGSMKPGSASDVRSCGKTMVRFSSEMQSNEAEIKAFLFDRLYRSPKIMKMRDAAEKIIQGLFRRYSQDARAIPQNLMKHLEGREGGRRMRRIADFIASMTDDYAIKEYARLFDDTPDLG